MLSQYHCNRLGNMRVRSLLYLFLLVNMAYADSAAPLFCATPDSFCIVINNFLPAKTDSHNRTVRYIFLPRQRHIQILAKNVIDSLARIGFCGKAPLGISCQSIAFKEQLAQRVVHSFYTRDADLPSHVYARTKTESFNHKYYFALRHGKIWYKSNTQQTGISDAWQTLGVPGRPKTPVRPALSSRSHATQYVTDSVYAISADGAFLFVKTVDGRMFFCSDILKQITGDISWHSSWNAGHDLASPADSSAACWDVSHLDPEFSKHFSDGDNKKRSVGLGVTHLYTLSPDGRLLYFTAPQLSAPKAHGFATPYAGAIRARSMSASGSTVFIIDSTKKMFTRFYDYDASGENPMILASYLSVNAITGIRKIPLPGWKRQPAVTTGTITDRISIFQTGSGSSNRMLRVEGYNGDTIGYFEKLIDDSLWSFVKADIDSPLCVLIDSTVSPDTSLYQSPFAVSYKSVLKLKNNSDSISVLLTNLNIFDSPCDVLLTHTNSTNSPDTAPARLKLHTLIKFDGRENIDACWTRGDKIPIMATLIIPEQLSQSQKVQNSSANILFNKRILHFGGTVSRSELILSELTVLDAFSIPIIELPFVSRFVLSGKIHTVPDRK